MRIQNNNGQFRITLPKGIALLKGLHQGKKITVVLNEKNEVVIKDIIFETIKSATQNQIRTSKRKKIRSIQDNNGQYRLTIPKNIAQLKNWKQGTEVIAILAENGDIILKEIKNEKRKN